MWEIQILCHFMQAIFRTIRGLNWRFSDFMLRTTRNILRIQPVCLFLLFKMKFRVKPTNRSTTVMSPSVDSLFNRNTALLEIISGLWAFSCPYLRGLSNVEVGLLFGFTELSQMKNHKLILLLVWRRLQSLQKWMHKHSSVNQQL